MAWTSTSSTELDLPNGAKVYEATWDDICGNFSYLTGASTAASPKVPPSILGAEVASAALGANVNIATDNTYYDGPSITGLRIGRHHIFGGVVAGGGAASGTLTAKLHDGTTAVASKQETMVSPNYVSFSLDAQVLVASTVQVWYISVADTTSNTAAIMAACPSNGVGNNASQIYSHFIGSTTT